jgi:hypothetical protein
VAVGRDELTIHQSPTLLRSSLRTGTTGAVLWSITPLFASLLASPGNVFASTGVLSSRSTVLELGAGVSSVLALTLGRRVRRYVQSDQEYTQRLAARNLAENLPSLLPSIAAVSRGGGGREGRAKRATTAAKNRPKIASPTPQEPRIDTIVLDWEESDVLHHPQLQGQGPLDVVIACDCVYNEALIRPLVETCVDACLLDRDEAELRGEGDHDKTVVIVAQELRAAEVLECFLDEFTKRFDTWRLPDELLPEALRPTAGYAIHVGVLKP